MQYKQSLRKSRRAVSPALSMVIITAATVVLVLVAGNYALQVIAQQRAFAEFETVTKSILVFDDAVRDIAWDRDGSRSVRFTTNYGNVRLLASSKSFTISTPGVVTSNNTPFSYSNSTGTVNYYMPSTQFTLGSGTLSYALGDGRTVVSNLNDSSAQVLVKQESGAASISLNYRVRVSREGPIMQTSSGPINYVDIIVIQLNCKNLTIGSGDFDLVAKNMAITTITSGVCTVNGDDYVAVTLDGVESKIPLGLNPTEQVIFNVIIADVQVT